MTIFIDASAIVAMIAKEPEATSFADSIHGDLDRITSPLAIWEAARDVESARGVALAEARVLVSDFLEASALRVVAIEVEDGPVALDGHERFGKGVIPPSSISATASLMRARFGTGRRCCSRATISPRPTSRMRR